jgi:GT2 family glycosyltransferase
MLASIGFVNGVGAMSEDYFLYFEELDWVMRGGDRFALGYAPESVVYHKEGSTAGSSGDWRARSEISDLCAVRSRLMFTRRYFARWYPVVFATIVAALVLRLARRQPDRAKQILRILRGPESYRLPLPDGAVVARQAED